MDKNDFRPDTRYTVTWRSPDGKVQAANIYVHRAHDHFLVVRFTGADAVLRKITYPEVLKIFAAKAVTPMTAPWFPRRCSRRQPGATGS